MKRWQIVVAVFLLMINGLITPGVSRAERDRPFRIGVLTISWGPTPMTVGLRDELVALGYREDEDFFLGIRFTQGDITALPTAASDMVQYGVDLIFVNEDVSARAAQKATTEIPIVFAAVRDPVGGGLIQSFARPGGNMTGVTDLSLDLSPKRLELFHQIVPELKRLLFPYHPADPAHIKQLILYRDAARRLGIELVEKPIHTQAEAQAMSVQLRKGVTDGILSPLSVSLNIPGLIREAAAPTMFDSGFHVERGALASYGPDYYDTGKQAARLVDKILKGANPAVIPVEVNSKIELVINLKTAKKLDLTIPPEVLFQADRIIR